MLPEKRNFADSSSLGGVCVCVCCMAWVGRGAAGVQRRWRTRQQSCRTHSERAHACFFNAMDVYIHTALSWQRHTIQRRPMCRRRGAGVVLPRVFAMLFLFLLLPCKSQLVRGPTRCHVDATKCVFQVRPSLAGSSSTATYAKAAEWCEEFGGFVISIATADATANTAKASLNLLGAASSHWVGYDDLETEGVFTWRDGSAVGYTNWAAGHPSPSERTRKSRDCVMRTVNTTATTEGKWQNVACESEHTVLCSEELGWNVNTTEKTCVSLGAGGDKLQKCYYTVSAVVGHGVAPEAKLTDVQQAKARDMCEAFFYDAVPAATLSTVYSAPEQQALQRYAAKHGLREFWMAGNDIQQEGVCVWEANTSGRNISTPVYENWWPSNKNSRWLDCTISSERTGWAWEWASCLSEAAIVCSRAEEEGETTTTTTAPPTANGPPVLFERCFNVSSVLQKCFFVPSRYSNLTWAEAVAECEKPSGGVLASMNSSQEAEECAQFVSGDLSVNATIQRAYVSEYWIGLSGGIAAHEFAWLDALQFPIAYSQWGEGFPYNPQECTYAYVCNNSRWQNNECGERERADARRPALCSRYIGHREGLLALHGHEDVLGVGLFVHDETENPTGLDDILEYMTQVGIDTAGEEFIVDFEVEIPHQHSGTFRETA